MAGSTDRRSYDTGASTEVQAALQSVISRLEQVITARDAQVKAAMNDFAADGVADEYHGKELRWYATSQEVRNIIRLLRTTLEKNDGTAAQSAGAGEGGGRQHRLTARGGVVWSPDCAGGRAVRLCCAYGECGMTGWDIKPQGVQGQLKVVGVHAGELEKALNALMKDLRGGRTVGGTAVPGTAASTPLHGPVAPGQAPLSRAASGPVAAALGEYVTARQAQLTSMSERIQAAVLGAATATRRVCGGRPRHGEAGAGRGEVGASGRAEGPAGCEVSDDQPVVLEGIPVFTGDLALLDATVKEPTRDGAKIATAAGDIHSSFGGLQAFYQVEADQLFATTKPVADRGAALKTDLATITGALGTYSDEAYPLVEKLRQLKRDAGAFLVKVNADDKWREDGDLVEERTITGATRSGRPGRRSRRWSAPATTRSSLWSRRASRSRRMTAPTASTCTGTTPRP